ncbi:protein kinase family protein [Streptomyces winkii]|uniref:hypothetical protein n=1 Tax=Streptomyces winkii TaxID=3051178 RepID=UPI0028D639A5|nr:hypothetical protein [Streptomyces sp. DSM 40971]
MTGSEHGAQHDTEELEFFSAAGELTCLPARYEPELHIPARGPLTLRHAVVGEDRPVIQYRLPLSARKDQRAREALEREAGAALSIEREYGAERYRALFTRFAGHNLDAAEPFVLYAATSAPGAEPLSRFAGRLSVEQLRAVMAQLTLVTRLLEHVGFVHRALTPQTVWWDGKKVRVAEPYAAIPAGVPREPYGQAPWSSPEQRSGTGAADPRDDLWSVAQLTYFLVAGRPAEGTGPPPDLDSYRQLAAFRDSGVFAPRADQRPDAAQVLRLLNRPDPLAGASGAADPLDVYRDEFERLLAAKRADLAEDPAEQGAGKGETLLVTPNGWSILRGLAARKGGDR